MNLLIRISVFMILLVMVLFSIGYVFASHIPVQCNDGIDNDLDGKIDYPDDNGCDESTDRTESLILGYADGCFVDRDLLKDIFGEITYECESTKCFTCVLMTEIGNYSTIFSKCRDSPKCSFNGGGGTIEIDVTPPELTINSPVDDGVYSNRRVLFDLETNEPSSLYWIDNVKGRGRWKRLASRVTSYSREISFRDGFNNITIRANDRNGNVVEVVKGFYVDSKKPRIKKTSPKRGFANGVFEVEFLENNPENLILYYGNDVDWRNADVDLEMCSFSKKKHFCSVEVNIDDFDGEDFEYWFELEDIAGSSHESKHISLDVDIIDPVIINLDSYWEQGTGKNQKKIYFDIEIDEQNFDEVSYYDNRASRPRWRRLCSRLRDDRCVKRVSFRRGEHVVDIQVMDEAGNAIGKRIEFEVN